MTNDKNMITLDELQQELDKGKTVKTIAREYGYKYPSGYISEKVRELGFSKNQSSKIRKGHGGINIYIGQDKVQEALEKSGLSYEKGRDFHYTATVTGDGGIKVSFPGQAWTQKEDGE